MHAETKYKVIGITLFVLFIAGIFGTKAIVDYNNTDRISYKGRTYNISTKPVGSKEIENIKTSFVDTGKKTKGMEIFAYKDNPNGLTDTVLYLKTKDGSFITYSLSGGP